jgi:hypothetical protein
LFNFCTIIGIISIIPAVIPIKKPDNNLSIFFFLPFAGG